MAMEARELATAMRVVGERQHKGDRDKGGGQTTAMMATAMATTATATVMATVMATAMATAMAMATMWAMATATRLVGNKEGKG